MKYPEFHRAFSTVVLGGMLLSCEERATLPKMPFLHERETPGVSYFDPIPGETWRYRVEKEIPIGTPLSPADATRKVGSNDTAQLIEFEQIRRCQGTRELSNPARVLTVITISENGKLLGEELYQITPGGIFSWGWVPAPLGPQRAQLLDQGVAFAKTNMLPGHRWAVAACRCPLRGGGGMRVDGAEPKADIVQRVLPLLLCA